MLLKVTSDTVFKRQPLPSVELPDSQKVSVPDGTELELNDFDEIKGHIFIYLNVPFHGCLNWYVYPRHIEELKEDPHPNLKDSSIDRVSTASIVLPTGIVDLNDSIIPFGNFSWGEATKNGTRIPETKAIVSSIVDIAKELQIIKTKVLGNRKVIINSWYRDTVTNRAVGGVRNSQHLSGKAVDIVIDGLSAKEVQRKLESYWRGGLGYGATFTHLDIRGYKSRFSYGK